MPDAVGTGETVTRQAVWDALSGEPMSIAGVAALSGEPVPTVRSFLAIWARQGAIEKCPRDCGPALYRRIADSLPPRSRDAVERCTGIDDADLAWQAFWRLPRSQRRLLVEPGCG